MDMEQNKTDLYRIRGSKIMIKHKVFKIMEQINKFQKENKIKIINIQISYHVPNMDSGFEYHLFYEEVQE